MIIVMVFIQSSNKISPNLLFLRKESSVAVFQTLLDVSPGKVTHFLIHCGLVC